MVQRLWPDVRTFLGSGFVLLPLGLGLRRRPEELADAQQQLPGNKITALESEPPPSCTRKGVPHV